MDLHPPEGRKVVTRKKKTNPPEDNSEDTKHNNIFSTLINIETTLLTLINVFVKFIEGAQSS